MTEKPLDPEILPPEIPPPPADDADATEIKAIARRAVEQSPADQQAIAMRDAMSALYDPGAYDQAVRYAVGLANSTMLPVSLALDRNKTRLPQKTIIANCLFLVMDAQRWGTSPYALLGECFPKPGGGGLAYQGKVIAGVVQRVLKLRLHYDYYGQDEGRSVRCWAHIPGDLHPETGKKLISDVVVEYAKAKTKDRDGKVKQAWSQDPDQKLSYSAAIKWARRYAPELVTGIATAEELEEDQVAHPPAPTPASSGGTPPSLAAFVGSPPPSAKVNGPAEPPPAAASPVAVVSEPPPVDALPAAVPLATKPVPIQTSLDDAPLTDATWEELRKLGLEAGLGPTEHLDENLNKLAWRTVHKRLPKLLQSDAPTLALALTTMVEGRNRKA